MHWFKRNARRAPQEIQVSTVHFVCEQDGPPERMLKQKLTGFFARDKSVKAAYLAKVGYGDQNNEGVALCLRTEFGPDKGMASKIGTIFASLFGAQEHLDLLFVDEKQESELKRVCPPFFGH
jgi:hypothetical protein